MPQQKDRWPELCKLYADDDGLPIRPVHSGTIDKLWWWSRYIDITTTAMVGHPKWPAVTYIDLFAGPGVCADSSGQRLPGSVLIAATARKPFTKIIACELQGKNAEALLKRLKATGAGDRCEVLVGDCNEKIGEVVSKIPDRSLAVAFIDPEGLHVHFKTIEVLANHGQVDLLILFADYMDIVRNVERYHQKENSKLDLMMGPHSTWRDQWEKLEPREDFRICQMFAAEYQTQLRQVAGYKCFGERLIPEVGRPLYRIIFASKHERGLEFWEKVSKKTRSGQRELFG